jgi:hypothetical protein
MAAERAGRARPDDDTSRLGRRDERVEDRAGLAPAFALEHDIAVAGCYPQARGVDRDAHIGPERVVAPGARGRLTDGHGRVHRATGRIFGRVEPEHHEGAAGPDAFDPAAKTLRLVHDAFERPRHLGRVRLGARRDEGHSTVRRRDSATGPAGAGVATALSGRGTGRPDGLPPSGRARARGRVSPAGSKVLRGGPTALLPA